MPSPVFGECQQNCAKNQVFFEVLPQLCYKLKCLFPHRIFLLTMALIYTYRTEDFCETLFVLEYLKHDAKYILNKVCNMYKRNIPLRFQTEFCSDVYRPFGRPVCWFGYPNSAAQKTLFVFSFFLLLFVIFS